VIVRAIWGLVACAAIYPSAARAQAVTFSSHIAPILQAKCQGCHRPGTSAPMSLLTYEDARPWARAIKQSVIRRDMPPWHLDRQHGIQRFKNDRSLTDTQIALLARWADEGAPLGDPALLPKPIVWPEADRWQSGTPDLVVSLPPRTVAAAGPDTWADYIIDAGIRDDRYIRAVETRPNSAARRVVHHVVTFVAQAGERDDVYLSEYAVGKDAEIFPAGTGRLISRGAKLRVNVHDHPAGEPLIERVELGLFFYPRGFVPAHQVTAVTIGLLLLDNELDVPANRVVTHEAFVTLAKAARVISFQPHMHMRGKAMLFEAIYPDGRREPLGAVDGYDFDAQVAYVYEDDVSPLLPAGTVLHAIATFDNTAANRRNPDPDQWVGFGNRSIDEMFQCHVMLTEVDDDEYLSLVRLRDSAAVMGSSRDLTSQR
jgi:hypothetical protein